METNLTSARNFFASFAVFALMGFLLAGCLNQSGSATPTPFVKDDSGNGTAPTPIPQVIGTPIPTVTETKTGIDKINDTIASIVPDGTYQQDANYSYPKGTNTVHFSVTVDGDTVTNVSVTAVGELDPISTKKVADFGAALPSLVVGKKINELNLPRNVAGSSLTNAAFQSYVDALVANHGSVA
jgi:hypothetical protein